MIEKTESPILSIYLKDLAEQAYTTFAKKYAYTPPPPIRIEVYRSHADFSVRTVGLAGLGALGVSFGTTLAFDSPAAKDAGPFNWGSTVWHELAHTFTLGTTDNRVPRWLSEGLSVYEEHHARPGWGFNVTPDFLAAFKAGKLVPVSRMNDGFMHPAYPEQVQFSYYQASLVCELIARDYGEPALLKMLQAYKEGATTDQVFQRVLNTDMKTFDKKFDDYLRTRFAGVLASITKEPPAITQSMSVAELQQAAAKSPNDFGVQLLAGAGLLAQRQGRRGDRAAREGARRCSRSTAATTARTRCSPTAYEKKGDKRKQADVLQQVDDADGDEREGAVQARGSARVARRREGRGRRARSGDVHQSVRSRRCISGWRRWRARRATSSASCASARRSSRSVRWTAPTRSISSRSRSTRRATTCTRARACCARSRKRRTTRRRRRCCCTLYDARVRPKAAEEEAMSILRTVGDRAGARRGGRVDGARRSARPAAAMFKRYFGSSDEFYQPPEFHGNPAYDGRFTFARIKYRGFEHVRPRRVRAGRTTIRDAEENFMKILRDITVGASVRRGRADRRQRDRRARRSRCCSSIR